MNEPPVQVYALTALLQRIEWVVVVLAICVVCWAIILLFGYGVYELLT